MKTWYFFPLHEIQKLISKKSKKVHFITKTYKKNKQEIIIKLRNKDNDSLAVTSNQNEMFSIKWNDKKSQTVCNDVRNFSEIFNLKKWQISV